MERTSEENEQHGDQHEQQQREALEKVDIIREELGENLDEYVRVSDEEFKEYAETAIEVPYEECLNNIKINVGDPVQKGTGIQRHTVYSLKIIDKIGEREVFRRYSEFDALRNALLERWPGIFIPPIPSKQILNKNDNQVTQNRVRFLNNFVKKIADIQYLYYSQEFQLFVKAEEAEVTKALEKFKRQDSKELLSKYQSTFQEFLKTQDLEEAIKVINTFESFIKQNKVRMLEFRKQARGLAEARDNYNSSMINAFEKILPEYEANSLLVFASENEGALIFKKPTGESEGLATEGVKKANKQNSFWLLYDLIKFQEREMEAMVEACKGLTWITNKKEDARHDIKLNIQEIENMTQGKTTIRSLLTKGTNEEIQTKLTSQNEELEKQQQIWSELQVIVAQYLAGAISKFKMFRQRFFSKVIKYTFSYEMHTCKVGIDYFAGIAEMAKKCQAS